MFTIAKAAEIEGRYELSPAAQAALAPGVLPEQFLTRLVTGGHFTDAATFLAHALPKPLAVWWACQCVRATLDGAAHDSPLLAAVAAAEAWAREPGDERRRAAMPQAEKATFETAAGCTALAVFLSGGSLAPPELPEVPPQEHLTATALAGALGLAAVQSEPERAPERWQQFVELGQEIARGQSGPGK